MNLLNIFNPEVFARHMAQKQIHLNKFINSGVAVQSPALDAMIAQGGDSGVITGYAPLDYDLEPSYQTDDYSQALSPQSVTSQQMKYRLAFNAKSYIFSDLVNSINLQEGQDPLEFASERIAGYWTTFKEKRLIHSALGVLASNIANDGGDMVVDVSNDIAGAVTDLERVGSDVILESIDTFGDAMKESMIIAIHSKLFTRLRKQNLIDFIPNSETNIQIPTYMGMRVIVDDSMPAVAGVNRVAYTGCIMGAGAFLLGNKVPTNAIEIYRDPKAGNGAGTEELITRANNLIHPAGFNFTSSAVTTVGNMKHATLSQLEDATNWTRVYDRKNVPMSFFVVND